MEGREGIERGNGRVGRSVKEHLATQEWIVNGVIFHELLASQSELRSNIQNVHTP